MAANIVTVTTAETAEASRDIRTVSEIKASVENKFEVVKKNLLDIIRPLWDRGLEDCEQLVTNFKVPSGEAIEVPEDDGTTRLEVSEDGGIVQVVMKVSTAELDPAMIPAAQTLLGAHYKKLFKDELIIEDVTDPKAFLEKAATHPKADKLFKIGSTGASFKTSDPEFFQGVPGVTLRTRVVNQSSFLSRVNDLPQDVFKGAHKLLQEFIEANLVPTVQVGNRTEAAAESE